MWALPTALPVGNTSPRLSHASDRLDPSYTRTCTCTRQRPRARRRARTTFPGETLCVQRCVTLQRLLACARAWYQSSAISVTFRTLSRVSRGDLWKVPREGTFNSTVRPSKGRCSPVAACVSLTVSVCPRDGPFTKSSQVKGVNLLQWGQAQTTHQTNTAPPGESSGFRAPAARLQKAKLRKEVSFTKHMRIPFSARPRFECRHRGGRRHAG